MDAKLKTRLDKIYALAQFGIDGERDAAHNRLIAVLTKHGLVLRDYLPSKVSNSAIISPVIKNPMLMEFLRKIGASKGYSKLFFTYFCRTHIEKVCFGENKEAYIFQMTEKQTESKLYARLGELAGLAGYQTDVAIHIRFTDTDHSVRFMRGYRK